MESKQKTVIEKMTLKEKAAFLSGKNEWETRDFSHLGIPSLFCADGPHGVRRQDGEGDHLGLNPSVPATCFPTAATIANSWDESLGEELGEALGKEAVALQVDILLGPGLNVKRSPLCGRNFEYFSEDPYLAGKMAAAYIRGIQSQGVYACPKHFAVNNQELHRMSVNSVLDERTLREIYLTGFEIAVKEGRAKSIMTSYNKINGVYANENSYLLKKILRDEWGFNGIVVTDWGGSNDHTKGVKAGSNLEMPFPGLDSARQLVQAVEEKKVSMAEIDFCVEGLLQAVTELSGKESRKKDFEATQHHELAQKAAKESAVLLKNEAHILPLQKNTLVAIIGDFAENPRYQGAGSSLVNPTFLENIKTVVKDYELEVLGFAKGYRRTGKKDEKLKAEALALAEKADIVLYFFGLDEISEVEGKDRENMQLRQNQTALLEGLCKVNSNIVGILSGGSAIEMEWKDCCKAILHGFLTGQAGAGAILDILTGRSNPSGKLSETYPIRCEDTPAYFYFPGKEYSAEYREGLYIGYRYYDTAKIPVCYPFGYGLSYTTFSYSDLQVNTTGITFTITNTGEYDGAEIAQLYVGLPDSKIFRPFKELKGFTKVYLRAKESKKAEIPFDDKTFRYWNVKTQKWETEEGTYRIMVGANIEDIRLAGEYKVQGTTEEYPYKKEELPSYYAGKIHHVEDAEFEKLLGHSLPDGRWKKALDINDTISQMYYAKSIWARLVWRCLDHKEKSSTKRGTPNLNILFVYNIPFRALAKMTEGIVSMGMAEGLLQIVNGHFFKGIKKTIGEFIKNRRENREYEAYLKAAAKAQTGGIKREEDAKK